MKRYFPYIAIAVVLVALNVGKWIFAEDPARASEQAASSERMNPQHFVLRVSPAAPREKEAVRDLFFARPPPAAVVKTSRALQPAGPPPKTPEELAAEQAQSEFARLGVTGIAFRNGKGQAYVTRGEESFVVKVGDRVAERFEVMSISADYVSLRDTETGIEKQVTLQGN
ncbi:MAG TPA: hypothetical protein VMS40_10660 [Vicinamibacterales bacterium]|nr:hypothetical protein [Vicinamibacterales bacterium]